MRSSGLRFKRAIHGDTGIGCAVVLAGPGRSRVHSNRCSGARSSSDLAGCEGDTAGPTGAIALRQQPIYFANDLPWLGNAQVTTLPSPSGSGFMIQFVALQGAVSGNEIVAIGRASDWIKPRRGVFLRRTGRAVLTVLVAINHLSKLIGTMSF
jgi:hypothetical protein